MEEAFSNDKLLVFSASNEGQIVSSLNLYLPLLFKDKTPDNLLNVTAVLNSKDNSFHLTRNSDGSISGDFINAPFTNLAKYCEENTIAAPGWEIKSSDSTNKNGFIDISGTSMAAPFVSGGAALVQQAFPYLDSKQIADVLLSTANNKINLEHQFAVTLRIDSGSDDETGAKSQKRISDANSGENSYSVNVFYFDNRVRNDDEIVDDIKAYAGSIAIDGDEYSLTNASNLEILAKVGRIKAFYNVPLQEFIGQGILDVGKAVRSWCFKC